MSCDWTSPPENQVRAEAELFRQFEQLVLSCGHDVIVSASRTVVYYKCRRVFAGAFVQDRCLEAVIDLLRNVEHPCLRSALYTTKKVVGHRFTFTEASEIDFDSRIRDLLREAYATVGSGTR